MLFSFFQPKRQAVFLAASLPLLLMSIAIPAAQPISIPSAAQRPLFADGEVIIKFKGNVTPVQRTSMIRQAGFTPMTSVHGLPDLARVRLDTNTSVQQAVEYYRDMAEVEFVQPNYFYYPSAVPNDPDYMADQLWGLNNTGGAINNPSYDTNNPGTADADMNLEPAWDLQANGDCSSVVVAVGDTGVNYTHQDLVANIWSNAAEAGGTGGVDDDGNGFIDDVRGWDFVDNDADPQSADGNGHGTHVAGTIGAEGNNALGGTGVCWQVQIMPVRVLSASSGDSVSVAAGINYAADNGAHIINLSLGGPYPDPLVRAALENARTKDVVVVVAAGNENSNNDTFPVSPCNEDLDNIVCVAALDQSYQRASFSNFGALSVDVGAPGTNVLSSWTGAFYSETFADWTLAGGGWAAVPACAAFVGGTPSALVNPTDWCDNPIPVYANNADNRAYKDFDLSQGGATIAASMDYFIWYSIGAGDFLNFSFDNGAGMDPFDGANDTSLLSIGTGNSGGFALQQNLGLNGCLSATCSVGMQLKTDAAGTDSGTAFVGFEINTTETNATTKNVINGTSMASPHTAGLAALIRAYNTAYNYADVVESIKNGGDPVAALSGITTTGRAVDANGSLLYLTIPKGFNATVTIN